MWYSLLTCQCTSNTTMVSTPSARQRRSISLCPLMAASRQPKFGPGNSDRYIHGTCVSLAASASLPMDVPFLQPSSRVLVHALLVRWVGLLPFRARAQATGYSPPRMSPGLRPPPLFRCGEHPAPCAREAQRLCGRIDRCVSRFRRWGVLRSEIKEEPEGRGTFAEQGTPSAGSRPEKGVPRRSRTSNEQRLISVSPMRNVMRAKADRHILRLAKDLVAPGAAFAPGAAGLGAAKGLPQISDVLAVDEAHAGLDGGGHAVGAADVLG